MSKRVEWIDIAKYICIMFVMLSHLESGTKLLSVLYHPFYLSVFFFASGYVYSHKESFGKFFCKKIRGLFVPWLIFSVFNILLSQILSFNSHNSLWSELKWNFLQIRGLGDGVWFVAALFVAFIPFYFWVSWIHKKEESESVTNDDFSKSSRIVVPLMLALILAVVSILYTKFMNPQLLPWKSVALPWHIEYIFQAMFFMVLGYVFKIKFENIFDTHNKAGARVGCVIVYLLLVYVPYMFQIEFAWALDIIYQLVCQLVGIVTVIMFSKRIVPNNYVLYVGKNTLIYFALHGKVYSVMQTLLKKVCGNVYSYILHQELLSSIFAIVFTVVLSVILMVPAYVINKWFPFVLGKKKQKNKVAINS